MNYLAHLLLSGDEPEVLVGNFMADGVKGRSYLQLPEGYRRGVELHRFIDTFTDQHPLIRDQLKILRPETGKWAGVVADVMNDHFLASSFHAYSSIPLEEFSIRCYTTLQEHRTVLPERIRFMLGYMQRDNWLLGYAQPEGLARALGGLSRRAAQPNTLHLGAAAVEHNKGALKKLFEEFYPLLEAACAEKRKPPR